MTLYNKIYNELKNYILAEKLEEGEIFYSEKEIMNHFGVSRITVRKAMDLLENEGLIKKSSGKKTIVTSNKEILQAKVYNGFSRDNKSHKVTSQLLDFSIVNPDERIMSQLDLNEGEEVYKISRIRSVENEIYGLNIAYIPKKYINLSKNDFVNEDSSLYELFEKNNIIVSNATERIEAILSIKEINEVLSMSEHKPLLFIERTTKDRKNRIVEFVEIYYKSDRYKYEVKLSEL